jgi:YVTN family beta-propeller protein
MTTDQGSHTVSVINTATNTVVATVTVGDAPAGVAIGGTLGARRPQKHHQRHAEAASADQASINLDVTERS